MGYLVYGVAGKVEELLLVSGLDVVRSAELSLSSCVSISMKVKWKGEMFQVNRTG